MALHGAGLVAAWPALRLWKGDSGLQRLAALAGGARVQAMVARRAGGDADAPTHYRGDMENLMLLECTLAAFLDGSLQHQLDNPPAAVAAEAEGTEQTAPPGAAPRPRPAHALYLAQCTVAAAAVAPAAGAGEAASGGGAHHHHHHQLLLERGALGALLADAGVPAPLDEARLSQINFWASMRCTRACKLGWPRTPRRRAPRRPLRPPPHPPSSLLSPSLNPCSATRSSLHYDPYQNLLCVAAGRKRVLLAPPAAAAALGALPPYHASANHSPLDLASPHLLGARPGVAGVLPQVQQVVLEPGDALMIPEGWWHQVRRGGGGGRQCEGCAGRHALARQC